LAAKAVGDFLAVSIQLVSPASGDPDNDFDGAVTIDVSIQLVSPASGDSGQAQIGIVFP